MASEAVKKILEAEALSEKKNAEARRRREDIISSASGSSSLAIQKISEAASEVSKLRQAYSSKLESYKHNAEAECQNKISEIKKLAGSNTDKAVDEIIRRFF
jgi:vacuolar-type H+-ATPase subunit H